MNIDKMVDETKKEIESQSNKENVQLTTSADEMAQLKKLQQDFLRKQIDNGKTLNEITNDFVHAKTTNEIFDGESKENTAFKKELKEEKKESIKETFKQEKIGKQTATLEEKQKKAETFYKSFRPILEFDFSNLVKNKDEMNMPIYEKNYRDRAYGISLMWLMLVLYTPLFCAISLILALFNGVNAVFSAIANFGKIAKTICYSLFIIVILALIVYVSLIGIENLFNIEIIPKAVEKVVMKNGA